MPASCCRLGEVCLVPAVPAPAPLACVLDVRVADMASDVAVQRPRAAPDRRPSAAACIWLLLRPADSLYM